MGKPPLRRAWKPLYLQWLHEEEALQQGEQHSDHPVGGLVPAQLQTIEHSEKGRDQADGPQSGPANEAPSSGEATGKGQHLPGWILHKEAAALVTACREGRRAWRQRK